MKFLRMFIFVIVIATITTIIVKTMQSTEFIQKASLWIPFIDSPSVVVRDFVLGAFLAGLFLGAVPSIYYYVIFSFRIRKLKAEIRHLADTNEDLNGKIDRMDGLVQQEDKPETQNRPEETQVMLVSESEAVASDEGDFSGTQDKTSGEQPG